MRWERVTIFLRLICLIFGVGSFGRSLVFNQDQFIGASRMSHRLSYYWQVSLDLGFLGIAVIGSILPTWCRQNRSVNVK
jgi:hypothetical protein